MNGAKVPVKTCYKCKADGHVRSYSSGPPFWSAAYRTSSCALLQIARDCPEGREPVEEEENAWGDVQEGPWVGGVAPSADANEGLH